MDKEKWMNLFDAYKMVESGTLKKVESDNFKCYRAGAIIRVDIKEQS